MYMYAYQCLYIQDIYKDELTWRDNAFEKNVKYKCFRFWKWASGDEFKLDLDHI